jgi:hypothetical protein
LHLKSFRFYLREPINTPEQYASDLTIEERTRLREMFAPTANWYRYSVRFGMCCVALAFTSILLGALFPKSMFNWAMGGFLVSWVLLGSLILFYPRPACPGCKNKLEGGFGPFCPECGAQALAFSRWSPPRCSACRREMRRRKARHYRIRACTYCGLWLDDKGL